MSWSTSSSSSGGPGPHHHHHHPLLALSACTALSLTYVLTLYSLVPQSIRQLERNDATQIKARTLSAMASSVVAVGVTGSSVLYQQGHISNLGSLMGIHAAHLLPALTLPLGSFVLLFSGPLAQIYLQSTSYNWFSEYPWINARNLVVAPVTEELVFRSCIGTTMVVLGGFSYPSVVFGAPLFFGLAHIHHGIASILKGEPVIDAVTTATFQTVYTTLFGALEMLVFLKTGHVASAAVVHAWCNFMGLPRVDLLFQSQSKMKIGLACSAYVFGIAAFCGGVFTQATNPDLYQGALWKIMSR